MDNYEVHGIDVSHYQSRIDWGKVAEQGIHFAFSKASEGETIQDSLFCRNWEQMKQVGILRGAYHFYRPTVSPLNQVNNFTSRFSLEIGDLPPVLDVEVLDGVSKFDLIIGIQLWLKEVELHYGIKPILYTNQSFFNKYLAGHFDDYPIWIARYNSFFKPYVKSVENWSFWQYGNKGKLEGIKGPVDFNVFHGNIYELEEMCYGEKVVLSSL